MHSKTTVATSVNADELVVEFVLVSYKVRFARRKLQARGDLPQL